jgi:hypothetical protein
VAEEEEGREHDGRLVEGLAADREGEANAEEVAHEDPERDEHAHVQHTGPDRPPRTGVKDARRPQRDRRREREEDPVPVDRREELATAQQ